MSIPLTQYWQVLSGYLAPQKRRVVLLFVLVVTGIGLQVATPQLIATFIDEALGRASQSRLLLLAAGFIAAALVAQLLAVASTFVSETVGWTATNALRSDLAWHCLRLDLSFHKTRTPGEMIQRIDGDVDALSNFFSQFAVHVIGNLLLLTGVLLVLFLQDWRIGLSLSVFTLVTLTVLVWLRSFAVSAWIAVREEQAQFYGFISEQLTGREDVRANGGRTYAMQRLHRHMSDWLPLSMRSGTAFAWMWMVSLALFTLGNAGILLLSFHLWETGSFTIGSVYLAFHYAELLRRPIERIREYVQELQAASASISRVSDILAIETRIPDEGATPLPAGALAVDIEGISFGYEPGDPVLEGITLSLTPGEVLGLLGATGSGKTTLGRLLVRLYDIDEGEIRLSGVPIKDVPLAGLRERVCLVTQDVQLFEGSVRDNLTFFDPSVSDAMLIAALRRLGLEAWLKSLPDGLDTLIARGTLSAGEAQLLACCRVFLQDPGLIVLDEATSRLDPATQRLVDVAVGRLLEGRTAIIIAHRLATVDRADQIVILENGRIVEAGSNDALLHDEASRFFRLRHLDVEASLP